jgi:hypothetical protein
VARSIARTASGESPAVERSVMQVVFGVRGHQRRTIYSRMMSAA